MIFFGVALFETPKDKLSWRLTLPGRYTMTASDKLRAWGWLAQFVLSNLEYQYCKMSVGFFVRSIPAPSGSGAGQADIVPICELLDDLLE